MAGIGEHRDSWGNATTGCEAMHDLGRVTWRLCGKPAAGIAIYGDGSERRVCKGHVSGALRKRTFYADEVCELRTLEGETTHRLERTAGRKGFLRAVDKAVA